MGEQGSTLKSDPTTLEVAKDAVTSVAKSQPQSGIPTLFPYGAATQAEIMNIIRTHGNDQDIQSLPTTITNWRIASQHYLAIASKEGGLAETIELQPVDMKYKSKLENISSDYLFQQTFSMYPIEFKFVEIAKLVAAQRLVNLVKVSQLKNVLAESPSMEELLDFCLAPKHSPPMPKVKRVANNAFAFSSPLSDFRFLGGFLKPLTADDIKASTSGGSPVAAMILLVGYGSSTCNAYQVGKRVILNNGFHRLYALAEMGIKYAPMVIQRVGNPDLEFPPQVAGLPKDYLLGNPRPVLMKDFLDKDIVTTIHLSPTMKNVQVVYDAQPSDVPI